MSINYIFSINSGRSGSDYLTEIFSKTTNAFSMHEGFPIMNGKPMQAFNQGEDTALHQLMPVKLQQINSRLSRLGEKIIPTSKAGAILSLMSIFPKKKLASSFFAEILMIVPIASSEFTIFLAIQSLVGLGTFLPKPHLT